MSNKFTPILITGAAGFIGSAYVSAFADRPDQYHLLDKLTYAGDLARLSCKESHFHNIDICNLNHLEKLFNEIRPKKVIHFAAESHVDRSNIDTTDFVQTNIVGTYHLASLSKKYQVSRFVHISTDEVYGSNPSDEPFLEESRLNPSNPYSSTKAAAELIITSFIKTHQFPAIIIRPSNNYGPWQFPEKLIPVIIQNAINNKPIPIYGQGHQKREWLHVSDCVKAIHIIIEKGLIGHIYNVGSGEEWSNITLAQFILNYLNLPTSLLTFIQDRPNHDFRYLINSDKIQALGWKPDIFIETGLRQTIDWYVKNKDWLDAKILRS